jgi:Zn-dependent membrane protease YugP
MVLDPLYIILSLPGLIIGLIAQFMLKYSYGKYSKISAGSNLTGQQAAELLNRNENFGVSFQVTPGQLNDYFDPSKHLVNLSQDNAVNMSVANIAVVAHEFGHVQQKQSGANLFKLRSTLVPAVNIGSTLGIILIMIGVGIALSGLAWAGVILFSLTTLFSLVTLPIEIDASKRGMELIKKHNLIAANQLGGAKTVLRAAALTYFAGLVASIGQLLYFVMMVQQSERRD